MRLTGVLLIVLAGCAASTTVRVDETPDFHPPAPARISVFGVFHDGRFSEQAWSSLAPSVTATLRNATCEPGYGVQMRESLPDLVASIDRSVREGGVDDALLDRVAPYAAGDLVMVLMSYRRIPERRAGAQQRPVAQAGPPRGAMRRGMAPMRVAPEEEEHVFELSASLFSVSAHKLVAQIELRHTGDDLDEAMSTFNQKLEALVPGARCVGWSWPKPSAPPDTEADAGKTIAP